MENAALLIWQYIRQNRVVSFTTQKGENLWSANAFYTVDEQTASLVILTGTHTGHGKMLLENPHVSGTISSQQEDIDQLKGIQFVGTMQIQPEDQASRAFELYCQKFPIAKNKKETVWQLRFSTIKYTDNSLGFGTKLYWEEKRKTQKL